MSRKIPGLSWAIVLLGALATSCAPDYRDPVKVSSPAGVLDLRDWDFAQKGPVLPQGWLWDNFLWTPAEGRPQQAAPALDWGPPNQGGVLTGTSGRLEPATAHLKILADPQKNYGLQVGALPGAMVVWVNGVQIWRSGVLATDPGVYRADGAGTTVSIQPQQGVLDLVVQWVSDDPMVRHSELNRLWVVGPAKSLMTSDRFERNWRSLQSMVIGLAVLIFLWISRFRPERRTLVYFAVFLVSCLAKLLVNVEQPEPLLGGVLPGIPLSLYLFLNHLFNLLPFPLMLLFLSKQFPDEVSSKAVVVVFGATTLFTLWEILPFVLLALGSESLYHVVMNLQWSFALNLFVVIMTLYLFERFYLVYQRRRPLAVALFVGGTVVGLLILVPVLLSYFLPIKFTYFLGWGMFVFLLILSFEMVRYQVRITETNMTLMEGKLSDKERLSRFVSPQWARRLQRDTIEDLRTGHRVQGDVVCVQAFTEEPTEPWLEQIGRAAESRNALLAEIRDGCVTWVLDSWSETGLAFALELHRTLQAGIAPGLKIVLTRAKAEFRIDASGQTWIPWISGIPWKRLEQLRTTAAHYGGRTVLDSSLQDGLVVGGWRRHRHFTLAATEIELYEGEEETLATMKDENLERFEESLGLARLGRHAEAIAVLFPVVQHNPFDQAARTLLTEWSKAGDR